MSLSSASSGDIRVLTRTHNLLFEKLTSGLSDSERGLVIPQIIAVLGEIAGGFAFQYGVNECLQQQQQYDAHLADHYQREDILRRNEAWFRIIVSGIPLIMVAVDKHSIITLIEGQTLQTLGIPPSMLVGYSVEDIFAEASTWRGTSDPRELPRSTKRR